LPVEPKKARSNPEYALKISVGAWIAVERKRETAIQATNKSKLLRSFPCFVFSFLPV